MPPDGDCGVTNSGLLNEMPPDSHLLAEEPGAGGAPPDGANFERLANKNQVNTTEDGDTLHKVASTGWGPGDSAFRGLVLGPTLGLVEAASWALWLDPRYR